MALDLKYSNIIHINSAESTLLEYLKSDSCTFELYGTTAPLETIAKQTPKMSTECLKVTQSSPKLQYSSPSRDFIATLDIEELVPHTIPVLDAQNTCSGDSSGIVFRLRKDRPLRRIVFRVVKGTRVNAFKSLKICYQRLDSIGATSPQPNEWVVLPILTASEEMIVCDWVTCPQTRMFNHKTQKGEKIVFSVGIEICLDGVKYVHITKDIAAKICSGGYEESSVEAILEELIDNPRTSHGMPIRVKIQRSRKLERQSSIEAMIDHHREGLAKLDSALQVERKRQERDLKDLIVSKSPPTHPYLDLSPFNTTPLPRPSLHAIIPKPDFEPLPLSPPAVTRPRSYSASPISPPSIYPISPSPISPSPYKPSKELVATAKRPTIRKGPGIQDNSFDISVSEISPSDLQESDMEGWLSKKSSKQDTWQKKWFSYRKPFLSYCSSNSSLLPTNKRTVNISMATIARLPSIENSFAIITRGRVWILRAEGEGEVTEWIRSLDPSRMVEDSLVQLRKEYDLLRNEMEQKDETISDLSAALDRGHEMASKMAESLHNMQKDQDEMRVELVAKNNTISDLVASLVMLNEKIANEALGHRKDIEIANSDKVRLHGDIVALSNTQRNQNDEITRLRAELHVKDTQLKDTIDLYSSQLDTKLASLAQDVQNRMDKVLSLSNPLASVSQFAQIAASHFQAAHSQLESLRSELHVKEHHHKAKSQAGKIIPHITKQLDSEGVILRAQLTEARQQYTSLHSQLLEADSFREESRSQLEAMADNIKLKDARLEVLEKHLSKVREEFSSLREASGDMLGVTTGCISYYS